MARIGGVMTDSVRNTNLIFDYTFFLTFFDFSFVIVVQCLVQLSICHICLTLESTKFA